MDVLYFAFANQAAQPLIEIQRENSGIMRLLEPLAARNYFKIVQDPYATLDSVAENLDLHKNNLVLFHFSGHAGPDRLELLDTSAYDEGVAALLVQCTRLKLVVLNGCATYPQVDVLQKLRIPLVIATHRPVGDQKAADFALRFYSSLSFFNTVENAFNQTCAKMLAQHKQFEISRGLTLPNADNKVSDSCWGLFGLPQREHEKKWGFSQEQANDLITDYQPNTRLLETLIRALAPYRNTIEEMVQKEEQGGSVSKVIKRDEVLSALPQPISEMVRFLLVESTDSQDVFFDQLGYSRLKQLCKVFSISQELMVFIMLAQLWDTLLENPKLVIPPSTLALLRKSMILSAQEDSSLHFLALVRSIRELLDQYNLPYFVDELAELKAYFQEGTAFSKAIYFYEELLPNLEFIDEVQARSICMDAEEHLAEFMLPLGFIARYSLTSVKNIEVLKNRKQREPSFLHSFFKLEMRLGGLAEEKEVLESLLDSASVLLLKKTEKGKVQFLNLSPFVIDRNSFEESKRKIPQLHFFERYLQAEGKYEFRHISKSESSLIQIVPKDKYRLIGEQFETFAQLLFHEPMNNLE